MTDRRYSAADSLYIRKHYATQTGPQIAKHLGRSETSVYKHAYKLGLAKRRDYDAIAWRDAEIRRMHAMDWSASEMESTVGIGRRAINNRISVMGLEPNSRNDRYKLRMAANTRRQCKLAGVKNLAEVRALAMKRMAQRYGWPDHLSMRAVQIVETLYRSGPMTRKQIAVAIGVKWRGSRKTFRCNAPGGSYLAELQRAGLVVRLPSAITHPGSGNHESIYMVGLGVEPCPQKTKSPSPSRR